MLLAIDIGNSHIVAGVFKGERLKVVRRYVSDPKGSNLFYSSKLKGILRAGKISRLDIDKVVIASVVPEILVKFRKISKDLFGFRPIIVSHRLKTGIKIKYKPPSKVGADRIANAVAAYRKYGGPAIIVDFGTAVTFDVISGKGEYLGGVISPGVEMSINSLYEATALLPKVTFNRRPSRVVGRDTEAAINSGLYYGFIGLVEKIIAEIKSQEKVKFKVIGTGGWIDILKWKIKGIDIIDKHLTIKGLNIIGRLYR